MKAMNYLQLEQHFSKLGFSESEAFSLDLSELYGIDNPLEWYSQTFAPELITKWFEGWECDENGLNDGANIIEIDTEDNTINYNDELWIPSPRNLDEFITNCQQVGIELELRRI